MEGDATFNSSLANVAVNIKVRDSDSERCAQELELPFWILYGALGVIILVGNSLAIFVFLAKRHMRQSYMNVYLVSLGFADVLMAVLVIPGHAVFCTGCTYALTKHCWLIGGARFVVFPATKFNLLAITYDRFLAVLRPLEYMSKMTANRVLGTLISVWTLPIFLALLRNLWQHTASPEESLRIDRIYSTVLIFAFVVVPVFVMIIVNFMIVQAIRKQRQTEDNVTEMCTTYGHDLHRNANNSSTVRENRGRRNGTLSCVFIVVIFIVCWIPRAFYNFSHVFGRSDLVSPLLVKLSLLFLFLQSSVNPFIYSLYREDFRQALLDLFSRG